MVGWPESENTMNKAINKFLLSTASLIAVFENDKPGWKVDENGALVLKDGNPIYIDASGRELTVEGTTISRLNNEAKTHREGKEAAETELNKFKVDGKLIDPDAAKRAIDTVGKIDAKKLIDAGEVDKVREQIKSEFVSQLAERDKTIADQQTRLDANEIDKVFSNSDLVRDGLAVPRDFFEAAMRKNFKVVDGKLEAYDSNGNRLMSKERAGEYANGDEALRMLVDLHPNKDTILKADAHGGSGNDGGGGNRGGKRSIKRADFEKMPANEQADYAGKMSKGEIEIVD